MIQRERFEEFQKAVYLGRVLGLLWGADPAGLRRAEEALELAIYQTAWDPETVRRHLQDAREVANKQREERLRDARLMDRVASYSDAVDDNDRAFPLARTTSTKQSGIAEIWRKDS